MARSPGVELHFVSDPLPARLSPEIEIACFRISQEALTNILRHANAVRARVELQLHTGTIVLEISDTGVGFDVHAARQDATHGASLGLLGMQQRAQGVGGIFQIESHPNTGTIVSVEIPTKWRPPTLITNDPDPVPLL
jgi:signal transduction histidine kinase